MTGLLNFLQLYIFILHQHWPFDPAELISFVRPGSLNRHLLSYAINFKSQHLF